MTLSAYLQSLIANWLRGAAFPGAVRSLKVALSSTRPQPDGSNVNEPTDKGYARQTVILNEAVLGDHAATVSNKTAVTFGPAIEIGWGVQFVAIFDQVGNLLLSIPLDGAHVVPAGERFVLAAGDLQFRLEGDFGGYVFSAIVNWLRGIAMPTAPALKLALSTSDPRIDGTGLAEVDAEDGYERQVTKFSQPVAVPEMGTRLILDARAVFGPAKNKVWKPITHCAVLDQNDNLILFGALAERHVVAIGDSLPTPSIQMLIR